MISGAKYYQVLNALMCVSPVLQVILCKFQKNMAGNVTLSTLSIIIVTAVVAFTQSFVHKLYIMALRRHFKKHKGFGSHNHYKPVVPHAFLNKIQTSILLF